MGSTHSRYSWLWRRMIHVISERSQCYLYLIIFAVWISTAPIAQAAFAPLSCQGPLNPPNTFQAFIAYYDPNPTPEHNQFYCSTNNNTPYNGNSVKYECAEGPDVNDPNNLKCTLCTSWSGSTCYNRNPLNHYICTYLGSGVTKGATAYQAVLYDNCSLATAPTVPVITSISPSSIGAGTFELTINGGNFDSGAVDQVYTPSGASMGQGAIKSRTATQIVVVEYMNGAGPGNYTVKVKNSDGQLSNGVTLTITNSPIVPTDKFLTYLSPDPYGDPTRVYWIQNGKRYHVIDNNIIDTMRNYSIPGWSWQGVYTVSDAYTPGPDFISTSSASNGMYIRLLGGTDIYKINNGQKEYISSYVCQQVDCWLDVIDVPQSYLGMFTTAVWIGATPIDQVVFTPMSCQGPLNPPNTFSANITYYDPNPTPERNQFYCSLIGDTPYNGNSVKYGCVEGPDPNDPNNLKCTLCTSWTGSTCLAKNDLDYYICTYLGSGVTKNATAFNAILYDNCTLSTSPSVPLIRSITGQITKNSTGLGNVTITLSGAASATTTTAGDGTYRFISFSPDLADGSYTITPSLNGYSFTPASRLVTVAGADITGLDFTATLISFDTDGDGYSHPQDCDDSNPNIHPNATELCNSINDDCDNQTDEGFPNLNTLCSIGSGPCIGSGSYVCSADGTGTVCNAVEGQPSPEVCDQIDNDCDGVVDEGVTTTFYRDPDGDGIGDSSQLIEGCTAPAGYVAVGGDNCPTTANPDQKDIDGDGSGDACEPDFSLSLIDKAGAPTGPYTVKYLLNLEPITGYNEIVAFNVLDIVPADSAINISFSPTAAVPQGCCIEMTATITGVPTATSYDIEIQGTDGTITHSVTATFNLPDTDGDNLADDWEINGVPDGTGERILMIQEMGADPNVPDIFIETDYMVGTVTCSPSPWYSLSSGIDVCTYHSHKPKQTAIDRVIRSFWNHGIRLHVDNGPESVMIPEVNADSSLVLNRDGTIKGIKLWGNYSKSDPLPEVPVLGRTDIPPDCRSYLDKDSNFYHQSYLDRLLADFNDIKNNPENFEYSRKKVFHYALFVHEIGYFSIKYPRPLTRETMENCTITGRPSGVATDIPSSDFIVSLGGSKTKVGTELEQAGTFMHELGHNLGLHHGGQDPVNNKPNYLSVMNYLFQTSGLYINGEKNLMNFSEFDDTELMDLDEANLIEGNGLRGGADINTLYTRYYCPDRNIYRSGELKLNNSPIDWNCNKKPGDPAYSISLDINNEHVTDKDGTIFNEKGEAILWSILKSYDDWNKLIFHGGGNIGGYGVAPQPVIQAIPTIIRELTPEEDALIPKPHGVAISSSGNQILLQSTNSKTSFHITNTGQEADTYVLSAKSSRGWDILNGLPTQISLGSGEEIIIEITTSVPIDAANGDVNELNLRVASINHPLIADSITVITTAFDGVLPVITASLSTLANSAGWLNSDVTITFTCSDVGSGIATCPDLITVATDGMGQIINGTTYDRVGNSASTSVTINLDKSPPSITVSLSFPSNTFSWHNSNVTVSFICSDFLSGIATCPEPVTISTEGAGQVVSSTAIDMAGNNASTSITINLDKTSPTISPVLSSPSNASGWHNSYVTVSFICADNMSGIATCPDPVVVATEDKDQPISGKTTDMAGNSASASITVSVDKTPPILTIPTLAKTYLYNAPLILNFDVQDTLSGLASYYAILNGIPINNGTSITLTKYGTNIFTLTATDQAGNTSTETATFEVQYIFSGFLPPVQADGSKVFKLGSTIPIKFQLKDFNNAYISTAIATLTLQQYSNDTPMGDPIIIESTSGADTSNMFRYDYDNEQYIFNLNTKGLSQGLWQLQVHLDDGTTKTGLIRLKQ